MSRFSSIALAAFAASLAAAGPARAGAPAQLAQARYVALGYDRGTGFVSETDVRAEVLPEEREALQRIRAGLEEWGRYVVVVRPEQADLLIAVRKGRLAHLARREAERALRGRPAALGVVPGRGREGGPEGEEALKAPRPPVRPRH
jgi:hypothetical protein